MEKDLAGDCAMRIHRRRRNIEIRQTIVRQENGSNFGRNYIRIVPLIGVLIIELAKEKNVRKGSDD